MWISIFWNIPWTHRLQLYRLTLIPVHVLVSFKSANFSFILSSSSTRVKKRCQHMPPQFGVKYHYAPKLTLIMIVFSKPTLRSLRRRHIKFPFYPLNKGYKYLCLLLHRHFSCSTLLLLSPQEHICSIAFILSRAFPLKFQELVSIQCSRILHSWKWLLSPTFPR